MPIIREGKVVGVLSLESSDLAGFNERDTGFVSYLAEHAAIAIGNARLVEKDPHDLSAKLGYTPEQMRELLRQPQKGKQGVS